MTPLTTDVFVLPIGIIGNTFDSVLIVFKTLISLFTGSQVDIVPHNSWENFQLGLDHFILELVVRNGRATSFLICFDYFFVTFCLKRCVQIGLTSPSHAQWCPDKLYRKQNMGPFCISQSTNIPPYWFTLLWTSEDFILVDFLLKLFFRLFRTIVWNKKWNESVLSPANSLITFSFWWKRNFLVHALHVLCNIGTGRSAVWKKELKPSIIIGLQIINPSSMVLVDPDSAAANDYPNWSSLSLVHSSVTWVLKEKKKQSY